MATIRDVQLTFGEVPPRGGHLRAAVTGEVSFSDEEIENGAYFRVAVELRASDESEGGLDWPWYPLHTFVWGNWAPWQRPYTLVRARREPWPIDIENDIPEELLDEDPGTEELSYTEAGPDGQTYPVVGTFKIQDEVFAQVLLTSIPEHTARSPEVVVPWSDRRVPND